MTLRTQLHLYLLVLQVFPLAIAIHFFREGELLWFFLMELAIIASILIGVAMTRKALRPIEFIQSSKTTFQDRAFGSRLKPFGIRELDEAVALFNGLLEELHREQLRLGEQKGFFDKLLLATPIGIVIHDFDDRISNVNPAAEQMLDVSVQALKGVTLSDCSSSLASAITEYQQQWPALITLPDGKRFRVQRSAFYDRGFQRKF